VVEYVVGINQFTKLLLEGIFDESIEELRDDAYSTVIESMVTKTNHMMNGQLNVKYTALVEEIKHQDVDIYLRDPDDIESASGCSQTELANSHKKFIIVMLSGGPLVVVARVHGFGTRRCSGSSSDTDGSVSSVGNQAHLTTKYAGRYSMSQFVATRTIISKSAVKKKMVIKK
jgi:hypothetical protein